MNARDTLAAIRGNKATKWLAYAIAALILVAIGSLWSPQSAAVGKARDCVRVADALHVDAARCLPLVRKIK